MIRVLVVDDHQLILDGIKAHLSGVEEIEVLAYLNTAEEALRFIEFTDVDVLLTDIEMPEKNGIWLINALKHQKTKTKIIVLTMYHDQVIVQELFQLGIDGYLLKTVAKEEMMLAIKQVHSGKKHFTSEVVEVAMAPAISLRQEEFSPRELEVLEWVAEGLSSRDIALKLYLSERTVEKHRASLMAKANVNNVAALIKFGFHNGLLS